MATRRTFLIGMTASAAVPEAALGRSPAAMATGHPLRLMIYDERFAQARAAAERARTRGLATRAFRGEISSLWHETLTPALSGGTAPLAGLTSVGTLFCLERMAWDMGYRVMFRIDHADRGALGWRHAAPAALPADIAERLRPAADFGGDAIDLAIESASSWRDCTHAAPISAPDLAGEMLASWIVAPRKAQRPGSPGSTKKG